ncbi:PLP-dependent lyase/thiolase [candidate division WWE3 bacterium]|uniref:L-serine ammonia-lyase n=1 Tax=candidate division WWE3 bacterium TaxID=2053526 RepID=A0A955RR46_UNCKA|nr:PLP-dependent lyase/thiolase [candidate division WWE3 bacterium]
MRDATLFKQQFIDNWVETPLVEVDGLYLKLENKNPTGSVKDRGLSNQIYHLLLEGKETAVISSSGNAAIAASYYAQEAGVDLYCFVPRTMPPDRLEKLLTFNSNVTVTDNAIAEAESFASQTGYPLIRQSVDKNAQEGYTSLSKELSRQLEGAGVSIEQTSVFFPVSSGTAVSGFFKGLVQSAQRPQIHIVQTSAVFTLAGEFDQPEKRKARSFVTGIVARRKENTYFNDVMEAVRSTKGTGWVVSDTEIKASMAWLTDHDVKSSNEGALALAGLFKARERGFALNPVPVVIIT